MSEQTDQLAKALAGLQAHCGGVKKTGRNPHFKSVFTTLADAWAVVRPALPGLGLAIVQWPLTDLEHGLAGVRTEVMHESGQSRTSDLLLPIGQKATAQSVGSAITYARRYSLLAICGVADDDDDGHAATQSAQHSRSSGVQRTNASRAGNQSTRAEKEQHAPLRREDIPGEALSVYDPMLRVDQASAEKFGRWASGPGKDGGPEVMAKGAEQAREILADLCGHKHWEATGDVTACARCGFVRPDDEEPESMADALGVAEEEVPF